MIIELLRKTGVRLLTSGKVCMENIEVVPRLQSKSVTSNGAVEPDDGYAGLEQVTVNVPVPSGTLSITENGTYDVTDYASAEIEVAGSGGGGSGMDVAAHSNGATELLVFRGGTASIPALIINAAFESAVAE